MRITLDDAPTSAWLAVLQAAEGWTDESVVLRHRALDLVAPSHVYATAHMDGSPVGTGRAVAERGWVGVFGMGTLPEARRHGVGRAVMHALLDWGGAQGAAHAYLQVVAANAPATTLYAQGGFRTLYHYFYRTRPRVTGTTLR